MPDIPLGSDSRAGQPRLTVAVRLGPWLSDVSRRGDDEVRAYTRNPILVVLAAATALVAGGALLAQTQTEEQLSQQSTMKGGELGGMMAECQKMMQAHREKVGKQEEADAEIDALAARMNTTRGGARVDAMAELLNKLVEQRKAMHATMGKMQPMMMGHMMKHMEMGGSESAMGCPMMKAMQEEGAEPAAEHAAHH